LGDQRLRERSRRARRTGALEDEAAHLRERLRRGAVDRRRLEVAAYLGHAGARSALERPPPVGVPQAGLQAWLIGLIGLERDVVTRALRGATRSLVTALAGAEVPRERIGGRDAALVDAEVPRERIGGRDAALAAARGALAAVDERLAGGGDAAALRDACRRSWSLVVAEQAHGEVAHASALVAAEALAGREGLAGGPPVLSGPTTERLVRWSELVQSADLVSSRGLYDAARLELLDWALG